jgi:FPC/CPF motif-containing protein YcgG
MSAPFFHNPVAVENSAYSWPERGQLVRYDGREPSRMAQDVHASFRALLHDPEFPCVGAKSVVNQDSYRFGLYQKLGSEDATAGLALDLLQFRREQDTMQGEFHSFVASFLEPKIVTPATFERQLWRQLKLLHEIDAQHFDWNPEVSSDPDDPSFSFSFAGGAYFVVGLSPASPRWARRFSWPTLIFNDHFQFERLREEHRFDRLRDVIRERDTRLHGSANAVLEDHSSPHSEARQYAGRQVGDSWRCPVTFSTPETKEASNDPGSPSAHRSANRHRVPSQGGRPPARRRSAG